MVNYGPSLQLKIATPAAGTALINGTPDILTWQAPNDGLLHRFVIFARLIVSADLTGGQIYVQLANASLPHAGNGSGTEIWGSGKGGGDYFLNRDGVSDFKSILGPGETVKITQNTAVIAGAAVLYAEIWGS
jgi:hypothetical protein